MRTVKNITQDILMIILVILFAPYFRDYLVGKKSSKTKLMFFYLGMVGFILLCVMFFIMDLQNLLKMLRNELI